MPMAMLDKVHGDIQSNTAGIDGALSRLSLHLDHLRRYQSPEQWTQTIAVCRSHPLREMLHQDPLTARAFAMSRGYQGDAELLDIIYSEDYRPFVSETVTRLGESIFGYTIRCKAPEAVRERRKFLASQIDAVCAAAPSAHILSVACGHLRELEESQQIRAGCFGRFVGVDQDPATIAVVKQHWGGSGIECRLEALRNFLAAAPPSQFDLIYAAGLFDYLEDAVAKGVTQKLFTMLRPNGRLLIGNYTPANADIGYMEAYMGWHLIYRDASAMHRLAETILEEGIALCGTVSDSTGVVVYLDIRAKG